MVDKNTTVSIPKGKDDPSYRYKREILKISYQGNLRTKLDNIVEVAHSLIIPPDYPLKFIGYELGSQTDIKSNEYTINGKHPLDKLEDLLEKFIGKYILCQSKDCGLPETKIFVKNNEIKAKCTACPHTSVLDNRHKMASYVLKNPPTITTKITGKEVKEVNTAKPDKDLDLKAIKNYTKKMNEENAKGNQSGVEALVKPLVEDKVPGMSSPDIKYFVLVHGLYGNDIYEAYDQRSEFLKLAVSQEKKITREEAAYHIYTTIINLIYAKYAKDETVFQELQSQIPSICYSLYKDEIFTEKFIVEKFIRKTLNFKNFFARPEVETVFLNKAEPFTHWFTYAPYEDEEGQYSGFSQVENIVETKQEKQTDLKEIADL